MISHLNLVPVDRESTPWMNFMWELRILTYWPQMPHSYLTSFTDLHITHNVCMHEYFFLLLSTKKAVKTTLKNAKKVRKFKPEKKNAKKPHVCVKKCILR